MTYILNRYTTFYFGTVTFGDIIDETSVLAYIPFLNIGCGIISLIIITLYFMISWIISLLRLDIIWEKIRNIKIK
jgi:DMSO/TMAO reductase YedYZ heme-binding membrane subunit